jgi:hypothetical protein
MGGSFLSDSPYITPGRMKRDEYKDLCENLIFFLKQYIQFQSIPISFPGKEDFGDIDIIVVLNKGMTLKIIMEKIETKVYKVNGPITSFEFHGRQVDITPVATESMMIVYSVLESYGMFSMAIGMLLKRYNIKLLTSGLVLIITNGNDKIGEIVLTTSIDEIFSFLKLDYEIFPTFTTETELYQYIYSSSFFDHNIFINMKYIKKSRDRMYGLVRFSKENHKEIVHTPKDLTRDNIIDYFDKNDEYKTMVEMDEEKKAFAVKYNGKIVMHILGMSPGKEFGKVMKTIDLEKNKEFREFIKTATSDDIIQYIKTTYDSAKECLNV